VAICVIFEKLPEEKNRPKGENSPNRVTLFLADLSRSRSDQLFVNLLSRLRRKKNTKN
jgi:hypothetical protein